MKDRRRQFQRVAGGFAAAVLLCTFFSRSYYNYRLPVVTVCKPVQGRLVFQAEEVVQLRYADVRPLYCDVDGRLRHILVREGERVAEGQEIMQITDAATGEPVSVRAQRAGVIAQIGPEEGMYLSSVQNTVLCGIADETKGYAAELFLEEKDKRLADPFESEPVFRIRGTEAPVAGKIEGVSFYAEQGAPGYLVQMSCGAGERPLSGEWADVTIRRETEVYETLIPETALHKDYAGYYVLMLQEDESVLGMGYTARRTAVDFLDSDGTYCAVRGIFQDDRVITEATGEIRDGSKVFYE